MLSVCQITRPPWTGVQSVIVAENPAPGGRFHDGSAQREGRTLVGVEAASSVVRSLVRVTAAGLPSVKVMVAVSCCCVPAVPSSRTVAVYLPTFAPSVIFENVSTTLEGAACVPSAMSSDAATPESVPVMPAILSVVPPAGSMTIVNCLTCCCITAV